MKRSRIGQFVLFFASMTLAAGITAAARNYDLAHADRNALEGALTLSRQIAAQADGLALEARQRGESDPISWAARLLSQGNENRLIKVVRFQGMSTDKPETYSLSEQEFEYTRVLSPTDGAGIKILLSVPERGFLGADHLWLGDLYSLAVFAAFFGFILAVFLALRPQSKEPAPVDAPVAVLSIPSPAMEPKVELPVDRQLEELADLTRAQVKQLGTDLRDLIKLAHSITRAVSANQSQLGELRKKIHEGLTELHHASREFKGDPRLDRIVNAERGIEACAMDADAMITGYEEFFKAAQEMNPAIQKVAESYLAQSRLSEKLRQFAQHETPAESQDSAAS